MTINYYDKLKKEGGDPREFLAGQAEVSRDNGRTRCNKPRTQTLDSPVHSDLFAINWPPNSPVRTLKNSVTEEANGQLWGHHPDKLPREVIGHDSGRPLYKFSTDSPLRSTTGDLEKMGLFRWRGTGQIGAIFPAAEIIAVMMHDATKVLRDLSARMK